MRVPMAIHLPRVVVSPPGFGRVSAKPINDLQCYYLETERAGLRHFLKCRTFGLCMAHNRLLGFHVVRSTRPVVWTPTEFVPERSSRTPRSDWHIEQQPQYPDPHFYLNHTGKYFFRNEALRHLRIEQYNRYWAVVEDGHAGPTLEDTCCDEGILPQPDHKDYEDFSESVVEGQRFASARKHVEGLRRRHQSRLAVSRVATLEPLCAFRASVTSSDCFLPSPGTAPHLRPLGWLVTARYLSTGHSFGRHQQQKHSGRRLSPRLWYSDPIALCLLRGPALTSRTNSAVGSTN